MPQHDDPFDYYFDRMDLTDPHGEYDDDAMLETIRSLDDQACQNLLSSIGIQTYSYETIEDLREAIEQNFLDGTLDADSILYEVC